MLDEDDDYYYSSQPPPSSNFFLSYLAFEILHAPAVTSNFDWVRHNLHNLHTNTNRRKVSISNWRDGRRAIIGRSVNTTPREAIKPPVLIALYKWRNNSWLFTMTEILSSSGRNYFFFVHLAGCLVGPLFLLCFAFHFIFLARDLYNYQIMIMIILLALNNSRLSRMTLKNHQSLGYHVARRVK